MGINQSIIIIGYDGSEHGEDALALGALLAKRMEATPSVATSVSYPTYLLTPAALERAAREQTAALLKRATAELAPLEAQTRSLIDDSPGHALHALAETEHPIAICIGSAHRGAVGRLLLGSVGEALLSGAPCAVAVAPPGYAARPNRTLARVGVGVDGSSESKSALAAAASLAERVGASLSLIAVVPPAAPDIAGAMLSILSREELGTSRRDQMKAVLDHAAAQLDTEVTVERHLLEGDPAECLAEAAEKLDLLIVGSRCYGPIRSALMGGVSTKLMRTARTPVLVVPRGSSDLIA